MSSDERRTSYSRRFMWLAIFIVVLFGGYSIGWFYLAGKLEAKAEAAIAALNRDGVVAECANPVAHGFPFRLGVFCDRVVFEDADRGVSLSAGNFRSAGQVYDPSRLIAELDGPARIDLPQAQALAVDWQNLRASVRLARPLPERVSLEGEKLRATTPDGTPLAEAETFEGHMRPNGGNLDLAGRFDGLKLDPALVEGRSLPPFAGETDLTVNDGVALLGQEMDTLRGRSGTIRTLALSTGEKTGIALSGPFSVDQDGLLDADLKITVRDPNGLSVVLAEAMPEWRDKIRQGSAGLTLLGNAPSLPLKIVKGKMSMGFVRLGNVPPLR
ncbi:DUF2125 domain-containing protein [Pseudaminobacter sp. NGMCC 1.201702]|uniref:DUF2125 domain-containing protein n=1 Tax=Pseudaminobacter sp. NGMCC 1.201702 TaxID=3391825 RepID=UPI0039EFFB87